MCRKGAALKPPTDTEPTMNATPAVHARLPRPHSTIPAFDASSEAISRPNPPARKTPRRRRRKNQV